MEVRDGIMRSRAGRLRDADRAHDDGVCEEDLFRLTPRFGVHAVFCSSAEVEADALGARGARGFLRLGRCGFALAAFALRT